MTRSRLDGLLRPRRLSGVDAARGIALLGMMAAHLIAPDPGTAVSTLVDGRASAAFAVLAGVGLALADGGRRGPVTPFSQLLARTAARAAVVLVIGLLLATLSPPVAVILQYYALLFLLLVPFLRLPWPVLAVLGLLWCALAPFLSHLLRTAGGLEGPGPQVDLVAVLTDPAGAVVTLMVTGYYPVLTWLGYLLVGAAVGRLALRRTDVALSLAALGAVLAGAAPLVSGLLGGAELLGGEDAPTGYFGTTPTGPLAVLAVDAPHSGTPLDLLGTTGSALLLIGLCLVVGAGPLRPLLVPLAAAGSMTLTLYTGHVVAVWAGAPGLEPVPSWWVHALVALALASGWRLIQDRGPLETLTAHLVDAAGGPVPPRPRPTD